MIGITKKKYYCWLCGKQIEFGSPEVVFDKFLFCSMDCYLDFKKDDLDLERGESAWKGFQEYEFKPCFENGFLFDRIGIRDGVDFFGNGSYIILDKCPFEHDEQYDKIVELITLNDGEEDPKDEDVDWMINEIISVKDDPDIRWQEERERNLIAILNHEGKIPLCEFIVSYLKKENSITNSWFKIDIPTLYVCVSERDIEFKCDGKYAILLRNPQLPWSYW
jgi:hypothetical protein